MSVLRLLTSHMQLMVLAASNVRQKCSRRLGIALFLPPLIMLSCGSVLQGPIFGSIIVTKQSDAGDAVVFLRCRGDGLHGQIQTDAEDVRVRADGRFSFAGSLTFPTTERCYLDIRHPRYLTRRVDLGDKLVERLEPAALQSWDDFFAAGPQYERNPGSHRAWPETELHRHLVDTSMWLNAFNSRDRHRMARYIPDIHSIYTRAQDALAGYGVENSDTMRMISKLEDKTAYPYPYKEYVQAVEQGDAERVEAFIKGGVLRRRQFSMLNVAAREGHLEVMDVLLANNEPMEVGGCYTPLLRALASNQWAAAVKLMRAGAKLDADCSSNQRRVGDAFSDFARRGQLEWLAQFLDAGVPVDLRNQRKTTALSDATVAGRMESVRLLLAAGANPDQLTADNTPLISYASTAGLLDIERALLSAINGESVQATVSGGTEILISWRLAEPQPYRVHTSFGQIRNMVADPQHNGVLWLATWGGLLRVAPESGERRSWTIADGLPSSNVQSLWFDPAGKYLWLSTNAGLARLPLDDLQRIETVSGKELSTSQGSGFLGAAGTGGVWYWSSQGVYRLKVEESVARHYPMPETVLGAASVPDSNDFFLSDITTLWRLDPSSGEHSMVLNAERLGELTAQGPRGLPQLRQLSVDAERGHLWIDSFRHGVFRLDLPSGVVERPRLSKELLAQCARTTVTPHMYGQVKLAGEQTFAQLERCFGRISQDNRFDRVRQAIDAGPVADARGDIWYVADDQYFRINVAGEEVGFPRGQDPLGNAQVSAIEHIGDELRVVSYRSPLAILDLDTRRWSYSSTVPKPQAKKAADRPYETVDPDVPELTWAIHDNGVYLKHNGRVVQNWPVKLPRRAVEVTRDKRGTTVWIASSTGLIEFPVTGSPREWLTATGPAPAR